MKAVFICLLLINGALFAWAFLKEDPVLESVAKERLQAPAGLDLLSESQSSELQNRESQNPESQNKEQSVESARGVVATKERIAVGSVDDLSVSESPKDADQPEVNPLCTLLGPFDELLQAEYAKEHLGSLEVESNIETLEIPGDPGFWVYLTPLPSRKEALRKLHELQAKGIDSYVIPKGDIVNGISFGMYSRQGSAQTRQKEVAKFGYEAEIKEVVRSYEEVWVVVQPQEAEKMNNESWQTFMNKRKGIERRENYCPGVASL